MQYRAKETPLRLIALVPSSTGIGFAVVETPQTVIDWGKRSGANTAAVLFRTYRPDILVVEDVAPPTCRKGASRRHEIASLERLADEREIAVRPIARLDVLVHFGVSTKVELARAVAERVPALAHRVPPYRKPWMSEDPRLPMFEALAFLFTVLRGE